MTEHTALYRKYRPTSFAEVKNQDHIVSVLEGAIKKNTIPHALLFAGPRGTGKTTLARLFAEAIGVAPVDLYEIDAASNRGIDDIRELKEAVHTLPYESARKAYIIDEVHMLTKEAFNALLKTLEEPPAHVIFMLATTEEEKLLDTILSRCQVFRMQAPSREVLAAAVIDVAKKEGCTLDPAAADLIAIAADGSFRDALGVTQKVILASGDKLGGVDEVAAIIGAPKSEILARLVKALYQQDVAAALAAVNEVAASNVDMKLFVRLLLEQVRFVMLLRNAPTVAEKLRSNFSATDQAALTALANESPSSLNSHALIHVLNAAAQTDKTALPTLPLELAIMNICTKEK